MRFLFLILLSFSLPLFSQETSFFEAGKTYLFKSGSLDLKQTILMQVVYDADSNVTITRMFRSSNKEVLTHSSVFFPQNMVKVIPATKAGESTKAEIEDPRNVWVVYFDTGEVFDMQQATNTQGGVLFIKAKKVSVLN